MDVSPGEVNSNHADQLRLQFVASLERSGAIKSSQVSDAFRTVPRHRLIESYLLPDDTGSFQTPREVTVGNSTSEEVLKHIYSDVALTTRVQNGLPASSSSQPTLVAEMIELLELEPGNRVLEIGAGTGYNAALMFKIVGDSGGVVAIDSRADVVDQTRRLLAAAGYPEIDVQHGDGADGYAPKGPYDRIVATVGCADVSPAWFGQLAGGFMLLPIRYGGMNPLLRVWADGSNWRGSIVGCSAFMAGDGALATEGYWSVTGPSEGVAIKQFPLWKDISAGEEPINWWESPLMSLWLYGALTDPRVNMSDRGVELAADGGLAVMSLSGIDVYDEAGIVDEIDKLHDAWVLAGRPTASDYKIQFVPRNALNGTQTALCTVTRQHCTHVFTL